MLDDSTSLMLVPDAAPSEMPSRRQLANRANALRSTGPRTELGKQRVASNALTHGLTAERLVLPLENQTEFDGLVDELWSTLQPVDAMEEILVERIIGCQWRLRRAGRVEVEILAWACDGPGRRRVDVPAGQAFGWSYAASADGGLERIGRYEDRIERSLYKALHELQRMQAVRAGKSPTPAATIDVEVNIDIDGGQTSGFDLTSQLDRPRDYLHESSRECALSE